MYMLQFAARSDQQVSSRMHVRETHLMYVHHQSAHCLRSAQVLHVVQAIARRAGLRLSGVRLFGPVSGMFVAFACQLLCPRGAPACCNSDTTSS